MLFLNRSYWPDVEATGQLLTELCEDLAPQFDVAVIAGQPHHNVDDVEFHSHGDQRRHGVRISRVKHSRFPKRSFLGRIVNYVTFSVGALWRGLRQPTPQVLLAETDPPILCLIAWLLARWHGCRLVMYLQDIYPDIALALGQLRAGVCYSLLHRLMHAVYRRADRVVVLSEDMRRFMIASGVAEERVVYLPNWIDTRVVRPMKTDNPFRQAHRLDDKFVVMYSGNLGLSQQLDGVLQAAEMLADDPEFQFVFVGDGANRQPLIELASSLRLQNALFLPYQPKGQLGISLSAADIHLVPIDPRITSFLMPSKLYGILASGTPVLAIGPEDCHLAQIVQSEQAGLLAPAGSPPAIADCLRWARQNRDRLRQMGERARAVAESDYDRRRQTGAFRDLLLTLIDSAEPTTQVADLAATR